jgi:hypothetical protein
VAYPVAVADVTTQAQTALLDSGGPAKAAGITVNFGGQVAQASTKSDTSVIAAGMLTAAAPSGHWRHFLLSRTVAAGPTCGAQVADMLGNLVARVIT